MLRLKKELKTEEEFNYEYPLLHAKTLGFVHPITKEKLHFKAPRPKFFESLLEKLQDDQSES